MQLRPSEKVLHSEVSPNTLSQTYPTGNASTEFTLLVSTFHSKPTLTGLHDLPGLSITVGENVDPGYKMSFTGNNGGDDGDLAHGFEYWSFVFGMPEEYEEAPNLVLEFETS